MHTHRISTWVKRKRWEYLSWAGVLLFLVPQARGQMIIQGIQNSTAPASNYDRYDNSSAWIGLPANWPGGPPATNTTSPYVWSGVGRDTIGRWATAISPNFVISANHFPPGTGDTIQFNYDNNPSGPSESRTVIAWEDLDPSVSGDQGDVWIGELSAPLSSNVQTYPILNISQFASDYNGLGIDTFGLSAAIPGNATSVRLGRNVIDNGSQHFYLQSNTGLNVSGYAYTYTYDNPGVGPDESLLQPGDSGGPSFFLYGGAKPALVGIHWFEGTQGSNQLSGDTWVSQYVNDIQTGMNQLALANVVSNPSAVNDIVATETPVLGDFNLDGHVNAADISAMLAALANLPNYESTHGMSAAYLNYIGDINHDGKVNNADLQALLNLLKGGGGSFEQVPEPASLVLLGLGGWGLMTFARRRSSLVEFD